MVMRFYCKMFDKQTTGLHCDYLDSGERDTCIFRGVATKAVSSTSAYASEICEEGLESLHARARSFRIAKDAKEVLEDTADLFELHD